MATKTVNEIQKEICVAYEEFRNFPHAEFGEVDNAVIVQALEGDVPFTFDAKNDALLFHAVDLSGVTTGLVICYEFNHFYYTNDSTPIELSAMCGGRLMPLASADFRIDGTGRSFKETVDLLQRRAHAVYEALCNN